MGFAEKGITKDAVMEKTLELHQSGLNGAQAVLQAFMDFNLISHNPVLVQMTSAWKGGIAGDTCSAYAAATLIIGLDEKNKDANLKALDKWFKDNFHSISCPLITEQVGGRPSRAQKNYCDNLSASTSGFLFEMMKNKSIKEDKQS